MDIKDIKTEDEQRTNNKVSPINIDFKNQIEIIDLNFQYNFKQKTLENINMLIPKNHKIAIVGESGSGKSTIAKLLDNFYTDYEGNIKIDSCSIKNIPKDSLRKKISFATQENFIFEATIRENLIIGLDREINDKEIYKVCRIACADNFINSLPQKLDTQLQNGGANLSGGQLQRLAIARAILKDSDILLLDEATSSLDASTEKEILDNIESKLNNKTIIIITHKLKDVKNADNIYLLKNGGIIAQGKHEELITGSKEYHRLWSNQF